MAFHTTWRSAPAWLLPWKPPGAVAQLEERLHGMQEVVGSNPISSTGRYLMR